jgi:hypothetical protein
MRLDEPRVEANAGDPPGDLAEALDDLLVSEQMPAQFLERAFAKTSANLSTPFKGARKPTAMGRSKDARTYIRRANRES